MALADPSPELQWLNVAIGLLFVAFNAALSHFLELGVGQCLITASARCIVQLTLVSHLLERAFRSHDPMTTVGIIAVLNVLAALETTVNKCKRRYDGMFIVVLASMLLSTVPMSYVGVRFAMGVDPLSKPAKYIPIVGMLCGNTISKLQVSLAYVLEELSVNRDKTEAYLGFGASRLEACKPIAKAALRLALAPSINQMSVLGIISIPGTMTGAMLGGSSVDQAARLQMIVAFMLAASSSLATIIAVTCTLVICVDDEHRVRADRIYERRTALWQALATTGCTLRCVASSACAYTNKNLSAPVLEGPEDVLSEKPRQHPAFHCGYSGERMQEKGDFGDSSVDQSNTPWEAPVGSCCIRIPICGP
ncbi:hypothetical protein PENSPDRAFT_758736 [Peniophora sp. CONT]|nr:hypothetical protein PENSPDRAFT_758736 [Peniophora sp. CONT]